MSQSNDGKFSLSRRKTSLLRKEVGQRRDGRASFAYTRRVQRRESEESLSYANASAGAHLSRRHAHVFPAELPHTRALSANRSLPYTLPLSLSDTLEIYEQTSPPLYIPSPLLSLSPGLIDRQVMGAIQFNFEYKQPRARVTRAYTRMFALPRVCVIYIGHGDIPILDLARASIRRRVRFATRRGEYGIAFLMRPQRDETIRRCLLCRVREGKRFALLRYVGIEWTRGRGRESLIEVCL